LIVFVKKLLVQLLENVNVVLNAEASAIVTSKRQNLAI